jgi:hypothetical protein
MAKTFKVKYATRNRLAKALQREVKQLGLIDTGALYDSIRVSAMTGDKLNELNVTVNALYYYLFQDKGADLWNGGFITPQDITQQWVNSASVQQIFGEILGEYIAWQFENYPLLQMATILNNPQIKIGFNLYGDPSGKWNLKIPPSSY